MAADPAAPIPAPLPSDSDAFSLCLKNDGLRAALIFLNFRTPHRNTGIFRFDGDMLRSVALVDKFDLSVEVGDDIPLAGAYCAHLHRTGHPLEVADGSTDPRVPWMHYNPVVSYSGALITDEGDNPWGALCHFDRVRCDGKSSDMALLVAAAKLIYPAALAAVRTRRAEG